MPVASFIVPGPDWLGYVQAHTGEWGTNLDIGGPFCQISFPPGWGGEVTDSIAQQALAGTNVHSSGSSTVTANKAFVFSIATPEYWVHDLKLAAVDRPTDFIIVAELGASAGGEAAGGFGIMAYPDICCAECSGLQGLAWYGDIECPKGSGCDETCFALHAHYGWASDPNKQKASTRHLGGVNLGFLDGHATWLASQRLMNMAAEGAFAYPDTHVWCEPTIRSQYDAYCGEAPDPKMIFLF